MSKRMMFVGLGGLLVLGVMAAPAEAGWGFSFGFGCGGPAYCAPVVVPAPVVAYPVAPVYYTYPAYPVAVCGGPYYAPVCRTRVYTCGRPYYYGRPCYQGGGRYYRCAPRCR